MVWALKSRRRKPDRHHRGKTHFSHGTLKLTYSRKNFNSFYSLSLDLIWSTLAWQSERCERLLLHITVCTIY